MNAIRRKRIRAVCTFTLAGALAGFVLGLVISQIEVRAPVWSGVRGMAIGTIIGLAVGIGEEFLLHVGSRRFGFYALNALRMLLYSAVMVLALVFVNALGFALGNGVGLTEGAAWYARDGGLGRDFVLALAAVVVFTSVLEFRTLHNRGELWRFLTGRYRYPEEEERLFLFADVMGSTTLAERLGNQRYSSLLRECFADTSEAILAWGGDVYQFAGDGVIVTWRRDAGLRGAASVRCFFEMASALEARGAEYRARYGTVPRLRGAVHGGEVVTTWVGEAKKELAFHGDTLNVAARIEAMCKEVGAECLISEWVRERMTLPEGLEATGIGEVPLRGSQEPAALFAVSRAGGGAGLADALAAGA